MRHLTSEDFQSTPNLRFLQLKEIKSNAHINFYYLHRLQRLDVNKAQSFNFLDRLSADLHMLKLYSSDSNVLKSFKHENLQVLDISIFRLHSFDAQCLSSLPSLRHFRIEKSVLNSIKLGYSFLENLETLSLQQKNLEKIDISKLVNLRWLNLSNNRKLVLSKSTLAVQVDKLEELYLSDVGFTNNKLSSASLGQLNELKVLNLSDNKIRKFNPKILTGLVNLKELDLSRNPMGKLEQKLAAKIFPKLEKLI